MNKPIKIQINYILETGLWRWLVDGYGGAEVRHFILNVDDQKFKEMAGHIMGTALGLKCKQVPEVVVKKLPDGQFSMRLNHVEAEVFEGNRKNNTKRHFIAKDTIHTILPPDQMLLICDYLNKLLSSSENKI